ncbi:MAG: hypothetical protein ACYDCQ_19420 [Dehalococcoidia bacterium]
MFLAPWVLGRPPGDALEVLFVFLTVMLGLGLLYLFGRYWQG